MSFCRTNSEIKEGDTAIVYASFNQLYPITIKKGQVHTTKYGSLKHNDLIGKKYGSRFACTKGSVYVMHGSPELWTLCLPHRTQILYTPDISMITLQLELKPGSVVVESGTGSASLSHALLRTIYPTGHLHTFEFHLQRSETARKEFKDHGLSDYVTVYHRDVCNDGFGLENVADAVFLDLPSPWKALPSAKAALKKEGGRICSFSPCIEQVQKTVNEMTQLGFTDMYTIEILRRVLCVKKYSMPNFDFNMDMKVTNETTNQSENVNSDENKRKEACNHNENKNSNKKHKKSTDSDEDDDNSDNVSNESIFTAKAINLQPGHTGFLTFATLLHKDFLQTN